MLQIKYMASDQSVFKFYLGHLIFLFWFFLRKKEHKINNISSKKSSGNF